MILSFALRVWRIVHGDSIRGIVLEETTGWNSDLDRSRDIRNKVDKLAVRHGVSKARISFPRSTPSFEYGMLLHVDAVISYARKWRRNLSRLLLENFLAKICVLDVRLELRATEELRSREMVKWKETKGGRGWLV